MVGRLGAIAALTPPMPYRLVALAEAHWQPRRSLLSDEQALRITRVVGQHRGYSTTNVSVGQPMSMTFVALSPIVAALFSVRLCIQDLAITFENRVADDAGWRRKD